MAELESVPQGRAVLRGYQMSASKVREVLDLIRGKSAVAAMETLSLVERGAAEPVAKLLRSAVANAAHLHGLAPDEVYVAVTFADEGTTLKRFRPRARGRAGRIRKRTSHITIIVERLPEARLAVIRAKRRGEEANRRARRVRSSRGESVSTAAEAALEAKDRDESAVQTPSNDIAIEETELSVEPEAIEMDSEEVAATDVSGGGVEEVADVVTEAEEEEKN
ncbi:MAG: 50S ribosomal protein L22 [Acidimicrobiales bacterium]